MHFTQPFINECVKVKGKREIQFPMYFMELLPKQSLGGP